MAERQDQDQRIRVQVSPRPLDCYLDNTLMVTIGGVNVSVLLNGEQVWDKTVRTRIPTILLGYMPIPFYGTRIRWAKNRAQSVAKLLAK